MNRMVTVIVGRNTGTGINAWLTLDGRRFPPASATAEHL